VQQGCAKASKAQTHPHCHLNFLSQAICQKHQVHMKKTGEHANQKLNQLLAQ
jgi:hypothetical protein